MTSWMQDGKDDSPKASYFGRWRTATLSSTRSRRDTDLESRTASMNWDFTIKRFGFLHSRVLLCKQRPELEQTLWDMDEEGSIGLQRQRSQEIIDGNLSRRRLLQEISTKLSEYDQMLLNVKSHTIFFDGHDNRYTSVRDFLLHGPDIQVHELDLVCLRPRWKNYTSKVTDLLSDPMNAPCLDKPLDRFWRKILHQVLTPPINRDEHFSAKQSYMWKRTAHKVAVAGLLLYWITHTTAALGLLLMCDPSGQSHNTLSEILLGFWYFSAIGIFVTEFFSKEKKSYTYARKVILSVILACGGGFYILYMLLHFQKECVVSALPLIVTIVLLLIKTM